MTWKYLRVHAYPATFGHRFEVLPFISRQPNLVHGSLTPLPRGVFGIIWKFWISTEISYFCLWKKNLYNNSPRVYCIHFRLPSVIDFSYFHSFPTSHIWYTASLHRYPERSLEFLENYSFWPKFCIFQCGKKTWKMFMCACISDILRSCIWGTSIQIPPAKFGTRLP